jgi:hypothetical protein
LYKSLARFHFTFQDSCKINGFVKRQCQSTDGPKDGFSEGCFRKLKGEAS